MILLSVGCTEVDLCPKGDHPHVLRVETAFDWSAYSAQKPDSMYVFMSNVINAGNYIFETLSSGGIVTKADNDGNIEEGEVTGGEYNVVACNKNGRLIEIMNMDTYQNNSSYPMKNLYLSIRDTLFPDFEGYDQTNWTDYNPLYKKLKNTGRIFVAVKSVQVQQSKASFITFNPVPITQQITFRVRLQVPSGVVINRIVAEISGVVNKVNLTSGVLDQSESGRVYFLLHETGMADGAEIFEGTVNVLGLLAGKVNTGYGPGILRLGIYAADKMWNKKINLTTSISRAELIRQASDDGVVKNKDSALIDIETELELKENNSGGSTGDTGSGDEVPGTETWMEGDDDGDHFIEEET